MQKMRVDKWLWCVRIYKSRTLATEASKLGRISSEGQTLKASQLITPGQLIQVKKNGFQFSFEVSQLLASRVSAAQAVLCYKNLTSAEELNKYNTWYASQGRPEIREKGAGRPTKKERREIEIHKESIDDLGQIFEV